jgi:hypothetical protein
MQNLKPVLAVFIFFLSINSFGQTKKTSIRKQNKKAASLAIKNLKNGGAVIYIVKDRKVKTEMLKERGMEAQAIELEKARLKKEKIIVKGLFENFKFCPIYFVYQSDVSKIQNGVIEGNLLDTSLSKNAFIDFKHAYFLFLEYGDVYSEQGKIYCDTCSSDLTGKTSLKHNAFVFKNKQFSQLCKPFPFYVTCHYPAKEIAIRVAKLNFRLNKFFGKVNE